MSLFDITIAHVIPARLGYSVLQPSEISHDCPAGIFKSAIVAWAIEAGSYAPYPITIAGLQKRYEAIECPDGQVEGYGGAEWNASAADWRAELKPQQAPCEVSMRVHGAEVRARSRVIFLNPDEPQ